MKIYHEPEREIPVFGHYDVVVANIRFFAIFLTKG